MTIFAALSANRFLLLRRAIVCVLAASNFLSAASNCQALYPNHLEIVDESKQGLRE